MCEPPSCFSEKTVRARTPKRCCECGVGIEPGYFYRRSSGVWDHRGATFNQCNGCAEAWDVYHSPLRDDDCGAVFGELYSSLFDIPPSELTEAQAECLARVEIFRRRSAA